MIVGIATLTIVASTMIIAIPRAMNGFASHRRRQQRHVARMVAQ
jgi:hypothetical protein